MTERKKLPSKREETNKEGKCDVDFEGNVHF